MIKRLVILGCLAASLGTAEAQLFGPRSLGGALLGGIAGGVIGHNSGRQTAEGIAIGAGTGLLLGALADRQQADYHRPYHSYGVGYQYPPAYPYDYQPAGIGYHGQPRSRAVPGALLGGIAGAVIGHNSGRRTAKGAAIGAGAGLVLGALADRRAHAHVPPARVIYASPSLRYGYQPVYQSVPASEPAPATHITINNYYGNSSPMSSANSLFGR